MQPVVHDVDVREVPSELLESIAELINANQRLRANLESNAVVLRQALLNLQDGTDIGDALHLLPSKSQRTAAETLLSRLTVARDRLGHALVVTAMGSGISVQDLSERLEETPEEIRAIAEQSASSAT